MISLRKSSAIKLFFSGSSINPEWFALQKSHGIETYALKVFMRSSVLLADCLTLIPALIIFVVYCANPLTDSKVRSVVRIVEYA